MSADVYSRWNAIVRLLTGMNLCVMWFHGPFRSRAHFWIAGCIIPDEHRTDKKIFSPRMRRRARGAATYRVTRSPYCKLSIHHAKIRHPWNVNTFASKIVNCKSVMISYSRSDFVRSRYCADRNVPPALLIDWFHIYAKKKIFGWITWSNVFGEV